MKFKLFFAITILICFKTWGQAPALQWQKTFGGSAQDYASSIQKTVDGGYIFAGQTTSNNGNVSGIHGGIDCWIVKISNSGDIEWQKTFGGNVSDIAKSIIQTSDGGYAFAGHTSSTNGDVTQNQGQSDYWVVKLDSLGNIEWQKTYGGTNNDNANSIRQTNDGGYIVLGQSNSSNGDVTLNNGNYDYWLIKLDSSGMLEWQKSYGGSNIEFANAVKQTSDNGYILAGTTLSNNGDVTHNYGIRDYWIVKTDNFGNLQWQKSLGGNGSDEAFDVIESLDGNYVVAGFINFSNPNGDNPGQVSNFKGLRDAWIVKLDTLGNLIWEKTFGGSNIDEARSIYQDSDGGYIFGGTTASADGDVDVNLGNLDYWVVKIDQAGVLQWQKTFGGSNYEVIYSIQQTSDNGYIAAGHTLSTNGNVTSSYGFEDIWIVKLGSTLANEEVNYFPKLKIYPNPAINYIYAENLPLNSKVNITDLSGKLVFSSNYNQQNIKINISNLENGLYIVNIDHKGKTILSEKLIVKK